MPRVREEKVLSDNGTTKVCEINVKQTIGTEEKTHTTTYEVPSSADVFKRVVAALTGAELEKVYNLFVYAVDLKARADVREAIVAESTIIRVDGADVDLMTKPADKLVFAINGMRAASMVTGKEVPRAFETAAKRLVETGKAREVNGQLTIAG